MTKRRFFLAFCLAGFLPQGEVARAGVIAVTGQGGLEAHFGTDPFSPNNTSPQLQLTGQGAIGNSGGVAVFYQDSFTLDVMFLNSPGNERKPSFEKLLLTAAYEPGGATFDRIRFYDPESPAIYVDLVSGLFVDSGDYGLIFPPGGIRGIDNGSGDFLSLDGALIAGVDLGVGLERGPGPPSVSIGVEILTSTPDSQIRFDVFGLNNTPSHGWNIVGNNPNLGAAGVVTMGVGPPSGGPQGDPEGAVPEPTTLLLFGPGAAILIAARRRRSRRRAA